MLENADQSRPPISSLEPVTAFRVTAREAAEHIEVGDRVRSYDFEYRNDCFVEGRVEEVGHPSSLSCPSYKIRCDTSAVDGKVNPVCRERSIVWAPVNGTPHTFGGFCNGVRKLA